MNNPYTYLERGEKRVNSRYFFVSYSQKDKDKIYPVLNSLYLNGINYWYDVELEPGDIWNERVKKILENKHCIGAFLFLSPNSIASNAVNGELEFMLELVASSKFKILPIIMGYNEPIELYYNTEKNNKSVSIENIQKFRVLTSKNIWITFENAVDYIMQNASKWAILEKPWSKDIRDAFFQDIDSKTVSGVQYFLCGKYPYDEDGLPADIEWKFVCRRDNLLYLVSRYCIDFVNKNGIKPVINMLKEQMVTEEYVHDIIPMTEELIGDFKSEISDNIPTDFADKQRQQLLRVFWAKDENSKSNFSIYNSLNMKLSQKIDYEQINAGIRLVLIINNDKIGGK